MHASSRTAQPLELATVSESKPTPESAVARQLEIEELLKKDGLSASQLQVLNDEHVALDVHLEECNIGDSESNTDQLPTSSPTSPAPGPSHANTGSSPNS